MVYQQLHTLEDSQHTKYANGLKLHELYTCTALQMLFLIETCHISQLSRIREGLAETQLPRRSGCDIISHEVYDGKCGL